MLKALWLLLLLLLLSIEAIGLASSAVVVQRTGRGTWREVGRTVDGIEVTMVVVTIVAVAAAAAVTLSNTGMCHVWRRLAWQLVQRLQMTGSRNCVQTSDHFGGGCQRVTVLVHFECQYLIRGRGHWHRCGSLLGTVTCTTVAILEGVGLLKAGQAAAAREWATNGRDQ